MGTDSKASPETVSGLHGPAQAQRVSDEWCREVIERGELPPLNLVGAPDVCRDLLYVRTLLRELASLMSTACWKNRRMNACGMGGQAIHYRAVETACHAVGVKFEPRDDEATGREGPRETPKRQRKPQP